MKRKNTGITLIALVITIIILLILAGVSISVVMGENGIATKAKEAKEETRAGEVQEVINLWKTEVAAKELDTNWGNVKTEEGILDELLDSGKIKESEINRTDKIITIGTKVIDYSIEVYNPYEIRTYGNDNFNITLYNKDTEKYEEFGDNVIIEIEGEGKIFEGDISEYIEVDNDENIHGYYPNGTIKLDLYDFGPFYEPQKTKITIYKNGATVVWEGTIYARPPG